MRSQRSFVRRKSAHPNEKAGNPLTSSCARTGTGGQRILTTYTYGIDDGVSGNDHGDLLTIVYSNDPVATPSTTFAYDRRGRQKTVTRNGMTTTLGYTDANQLISESHAGGTLNTYSETITPDSLQRKYQMTPRRGTTVLGGTIIWTFFDADD